MKKPDYSKMYAVETEAANILNGIAFGYTDADGQIVPGRAAELSDSERRILHKSIEEYSYRFAENYVSGTNNWENREEFEKYIAAESIMNKIGIIPDSPAVSLKARIPYATKNSTGIRCMPYSREKNWIRYEEETPDGLEKAHTVKCTDNGLDFSVAVKVTEKKVDGKPRYSCEIKSNLIPGDAYTKDINEKEAKYFKSQKGVSAVTDYVANNIKTTPFEEWGKAVLQSAFKLARDLFYDGVDLAKNIFSIGKPARSEYMKIEPYIDKGYNLSFRRGKQVDNGYILESSDRSFYLKDKEIEKLIGDNKIHVNGLEMKNGELHSCNIYENHGVGEPSSLENTTSFSKLDAKMKNSSETNSHILFGSAGTRTMSGQKNSISQKI